MAFHLEDKGAPLKSTLKSGEHVQAFGIDGVNAYPLCADNGVGERITCALAATNYTGSNIPAGTIAVEINAPNSADLWVNIGADAAIVDKAVTPLSSRGRCVRAGMTYMMAIETADIGKALHFMFEIATAQTVDVTFIQR